MNIKEASETAKTRLAEVLNKKLDIKLDLIVSPDRDAERKMKELGMKIEKSWILTFKELLSNTNFL